MPPGKLSIMHRIGYYMCTDVLDIICKRILNALHKSGGNFHRTLVCCTNSRSGYNQGLLLWAQFMEEMGGGG